MSTRHVFYITGLPDLREETTISIVIPANAGDNFPIEMDFPIDLLSDQRQLTMAPIVPQSQFGLSLGQEPEVGTSFPSPVFGQSQNALVSSVPSKLAMSPTNIAQQSMASQQLTKMSASLSKSVTGQSPVSPGRQGPVVSSKPTLLLPSLGEPPRPSLQSYPMNPMTELPKKPTVQPRGMSTKTTETGQELAQTFLSSPVPMEISSRPSLLTSQKMMSPSKIQSLKAELKDNKSQDVEPPKRSEPNSKVNTTIIMAMQSCPIRKSSQGSGSSPYSPNAPMIPAEPKRMSMRSGTGTGPRNSLTNVQFPETQVGKAQQSKIMSPSELLKQYSTMNN